MEVLVPVLTIFVLMVLGFSSVKLKVLDSKGISALNALVLFYAQPCLILSKMQQDVTPELLSELGWMFVMTCVIMSVTGIGAWFIFRKQPHDRRAVLANLVMASNCGFMGYPVIGAAMGEHCIIYAVMYVSAFNAVCWTLGAYFYRGRSAMNLRQIITNPTVLAVLGGGVLLITGWRLPDFLNSAMTYMGNITTPVAMFIIGARLINVKRSDLADKSMLLACGLRLLVVPLLVLPFVRALPLSSNVAGALFLCSAMPSASLTGMQSDLYDCEKDLASRGVAISTAFSLLTVSLMLMLM